jgi:glycosyltransferase involved in cell wall biosynthesis
LFSVVIAAHNAEDTIRATLESVLAQTCADFEVIVVDDGSTDRTAGVVEGLEHEAIRLIRQSNAGPAAARNAGIAVARGTFVSFLDADDVWLPRYLELMLDAFRSEPEAGVAFTDAWAWDEALARFRRRTVMFTESPSYLPVDPRQLFRLLIVRNFFFVSATVRRDVFAKVGGFDTAIFGSEDWELWLRIVANGYRAVRAQGVLAVYRVRAGSISSDREVMSVAEAAVLQKVLTYDLSEEERALVQQRVAGVMQRTEPAEGLIGRERVTRRLPSWIRLRNYRLRRPYGVPSSVASLLRDPHGSS